MEGEAEILQQRIEAGTLRCGCRQSFERIGAADNKGIEPGTDCALSRQNSLYRLFGQAFLQRSDGRARQGHHSDPQRHGTFVITPRTGDLIQQRFVGMRIARDQFH